MWILLLVLAALIIGKIWFNGAKYTGPLPNLTGKLTIITGGNSGIGAEVVKKMAALHCRVIIADITDATPFAKQLNAQLG